MHIRFGYTKWLQLGIPDVDLHPIGQYFFKRSSLNWLPLVQNHGGIPRKVEGHRDGVRERVTTQKVECFLRTYLLVLGVDKPVGSCLGS